MSDNSISYDLNDYKIAINKVLGKKDNYNKNDIIKYLNSKYSVELFQDFENFLKAQNLKIGDFGVNTIEDYTDGMIEDGNILYCIFRNKNDFKKITYKDEDFYTEYILKFDDSNNLINFFGTGDYIDFENEVNIFIKRKNYNVR